jgi:benzodiazapine receptor
MNRDSVRQVINVLAVVATLVVNALANALPLNGHLTGAISDQFKVYFVPAGYVFAIWGLIYIGLIAFAIYQALPAQRENPRLRRIGYWFALSCVANIVWLFLWHYEVFVLTIIVMLALLLSLIVIYLRLDIGHRQVTLAGKWCVNIPVSIYLGWITVATIANASDVLDYLNWNGGGITPQVWTIIMLVAGLGLAAAMSFTRGDIAYQMVLVWAFVGIAVKQAGTPLVANAAWVMSGLVVLVLIGGVIFRKGRKP